MYNKKCSICGKEFVTKYKNKNICDFTCQTEAQRERSRLYNRRRRNKKIQDFPPCEVCGTTLVTEPHHEPEGIHHLCPTHHAAITRNIKTLAEMLNPINT